MCSGFCCSITTSVIGAVLVLGSTLTGFFFLPNLVRDAIISETVLLDDSIQLERFKEIPFALNLTVRLFNITNPEEIIRGAVPIVEEVGPYVYKLHSFRDVHELQSDSVGYRKLDHFEFDQDGSFPNTEDDVVTVVNIAYHSVLQIVENMFPGILPLLRDALHGIFGQNTEPTLQVRVSDLLFKGIRLCENPEFPASIVCLVMQQMSDSIQNMDKLNDGSVIFSILAYRDGRPTGTIDALRGINDPADLGRITSYQGRPHLTNWPSNEYSLCNMLNGTDSGVFRPFIDKTQSIYALNPDICRSVELRYSSDTEYKGIPAWRFTANEWFLDNHERCFCLNQTKGVTADDGCLLTGTMELYSCVDFQRYSGHSRRACGSGHNAQSPRQSFPKSSNMVLSYPHFLYADARYRNGVVGMFPVEEDHRIFMDIEPNTGVVVKGAKRAQFNMFMRPIKDITNTLDLLTTLTPILWVEEGVELPDEFVEEITSELLYGLNLLNIIVPVAVAVSCLVLVVGLVAVAWIRAKRPVKA